MKPVNFIQETIQVCASHQSNAENAPDSAIMNTQNVKSSNDTDNNSFFSPLFLS